MKTYFYLLGVSVLLISSTSFAKDNHQSSTILHCEWSEALQKVSEADTSVSTEKTLAFENDSFKIWLQQKSDQAFEIEVFHKNDFMRTWTQGLLNTPTDRLQWGLWSRDALVDFTCSKKILPLNLWKTDCVNGQIRTQNFSTLRTTASEIFHTDSNCQNPLIKLSSTGALDTSFEANELNYTFEESEITLYTDSIVTDYNTRKVCDITNWQKNKPISVLNKKCALINGAKPVTMPTKGQKKYGIYNLTTNQLTFGQLTPEKDGSTPEKRPTELNQKFPYTPTQNF